MITLAAIARVSAHLERLAFERRADLAAAALAEALREREVEVAVAIERQYEPTTRLERRRRG